MTETKHAPSSTKDQLEEASWALMSFYENLSTIYRSARTLAGCDSLEGAAKVTLDDVVEITGSTGGLICIPRKEEMILLAGRNGDASAFEAAKVCFQKYGDNPYYEDKPGYRFYTEDAREGKSCLYVPFEMDNDEKGIIFLFSDTPKEYTSIDIKFVQILGSQGALTIRCFLHLEELKEKNEALEETLNQLTQTQKELVKSEKLSTLGEMATIIIHDLKNPMGGILGYAQLLESMPGTLSQDEVREYAGSIAKETLRLSNLTEEIMEYSRGIRAKLNKREMTAKGLVAIAVHMIHACLEGNSVTFQWEDLDNERLFLADSDKMERVFINMAAFAARSMERGGTLTVRSDFVEDWVEYALIDTGSGMDPEIKDRVFEPFITRIKGKSLGLEMAVARWIVEAHSGKIWVESSSEEGTDVRIRLPAPE